MFGSFWALLAIFAAFLPKARGLFEYELRHNVSAADFEKTIRQFADWGHRAKWVSAYMVDGVEQPFFSCIFEDLKGAAVDIELVQNWIPGNDAERVFQYYNDGGYNALFINGFGFKGQEFFVAAWDAPDVTPVSRQKIIHGLSWPAYDQAAGAFRNMGYQEVHISVYFVGDRDVRFAALFTPASSSPVGPIQPFYNVDFEEFQAVWDGCIKGHLRPLSVSAISYWYQGTKHEYYYMLWAHDDGTVPFASLSSISADALVSQNENYTYQGYVPRVVSGYDPTNNRFSVLWDSPYLLTKDVQAINNGIWNFMTAHGIPGMGIAITKNDRLVFARGYGLASTDTQAPVTHKSRFRLASITKSITAVAIMGLLERGQLQLDSKVFGPGSLTGDYFGTVYTPNITDITVTNLLEMQAGFSDPPLSQLSRMSIRDVIKTHISVINLKWAPGDGWSYSNFGYLVLGQVIERVTHGSYQDWVVDEILARCSARSLQLGSDTGLLPDEVSYYPANLVAEDPISKYSSFGGWVGTAIDVMRWSVRFDGINFAVDMLDSDTEADMWRPTKWKPDFYTKGWKIDGTGTWQGHDGRLMYTNTMLVQRNDNGYGYVGFMNRGDTVDSGFDIQKVMDPILAGLQIGDEPTWDLFNGIYLNNPSSADDGSEGDGAQKILQ
ncbi:beta-lactamase/transpeptidase-like protein [Lasiosphaeria hispida]|uniref:Beta-lactamase/transpeptidase-like protein n=1 Tax=Lasiosphaeria hispida TaxID=260671 RepID=A0AAJ0HAG2_9PEZI|nr:beta-lactamase/transpeptidase-like protein [Lasiosphaeria hispida]